MRLLLNGLPKSGLHLLEAYIKPVLSAPDDPWASTLSWDLQWCDPQEWQDSMAAVEPAQYVKGHVGYAQWAIDTLQDDWRQVFIARDLRDVAVSQMHHILSDDPLLKHDGREVYQALDNEEQVLLAIIEGVGLFAGLAQRWRLFSGWLGRDDVLVIHYTDAINERMTTARKLLRHAGMRVNPALLVCMVDASYDSLTLRNGKTGEWRQWWTPRVQSCWERNVSDALSRAAT